MRIVTRMILLRGLRICPLQQATADRATGFASFTRIRSIVSVANRDNRLGNFHSDHLRLGHSNVPKEALVPSS